MTEKRARKRKWHLYIVVCNDRTYYTGITTDIRRRMEMHNCGRGAQYTKSRVPVKLAYEEECKSRSDALKKEYAMKQLTRAGKEEYMREHGKQGL